jgi:hypothetical protein
MLQAQVFNPPRRRGLAVHGALITLLVGAAGAALVAALRIDASLPFLLYLGLAVVLVSPTPVLFYRAYALLQSWYAVEREGIRLQWGLRGEDIPMPAIRWVNPASDLSRPLPLPWLGLPGSLLGTRQVEGLGAVEYLASGRSNLILIATQERVFAISPENPSAFLRAFQDQTELGSLSPMPARSLAPINLVGRVWTDLAARYVLAAGALLSLGVLVWVAWVASTQAQVPLGFRPGGEPRVSVPSIQLSLLPLIHSFFFTADLALGLFFYRREESRVLAYLLWIGGAVTSLLFLGAMFWIFQAG